MAACPSRDDDGMSTEKLGGKKGREYGKEGVVRSGSV